VLISKSIDVIARKSSYIVFKVLFSPINEKVNKPERQEVLTETEV